MSGASPTWQTVYTCFRNWRKDGTLIEMHNGVREFTRIEAQRHPSPSEGSIGSQSAKCQTCRNGA